MSLIVFGSFLPTQKVSSSEEKSINTLDTGDASTNEVLRYQIETKKVHVMGQPILINFTLKNTSNSLLWILTWYTPFEGLLGDIFQVTCDNKEISYEGPMVKRGTPTKNDYIFIKPGESISIKTDLSLAYALPLDKNCQVKFVGIIHDIIFNKESLSDRTDKNHNIKIPGNTVIFSMTQHN